MASRAPGARRISFKDRAEKYGLLVGRALLILGFGLVAAPMLTWPPYVSMLGLNAIIVVLTLGPIVPLTAGDFDLSVASTLTLSAMLVAILNVKAGLPIPVAVGCALLLGVAVGAVNAFFALYFRIHSLIVTLGVGYFLNGVTLWASNSAVVFGTSLTPLVKATFSTKLFRRVAAVLVRADPDNCALVPIRVHRRRPPAIVRRAGARSGAAQRRQGGPGAGAITDRLRPRGGVRRRALHGHAPLGGPEFQPRLPVARVRGGVWGRPRSIPAGSIRGARSSRCISRRRAYWG